MLRLMQMTIHIPASVLIETTTAWETAKEDLFPNIEVCRWTCSLVRRRRQLALSIPGSLVRAQRPER